MRTVLPSPEIEATLATLVRRFLGARRFGAAAVAVAVDDVLTEPVRPGRLLVDDDVLVRLTVRATEGDESLILPLGDIWRVWVSGAEIVDIAAHADAVLWVACSLAYDVDSGASLDRGSYFAAVIDRRGEGRLAWADGIYMEHAARSGVPAERRRQGEAVAELEAQYGRSVAKDLAASVTAAAIVEALATLPAGATSGWILIGPQGVTVGPRGYRGPTVAGRVTDALALEAYGARRPEQAGATVGRDIDEADEVRFVGMSEFSSTRARHPEGLATLLAEGGGARWLDALGDPSRSDRSRLRELLAFSGLTTSQAEALLLTDEGLSQREVAERLGIDPSTVSRTLERARRRIRHIDTRS